MVQLPWDSSVQPWLLSSAGLVGPVVNGGMQHQHPWTSGARAEGTVNQDPHTRQQELEPEELELRGSQRKVIFCLTKVPQDIGLQGWVGFQLSRDEIGMFPRG